MIRFAAALTIFLAAGAAARAADVPFAKALDQMRAVYRDVYRAHLSATLVTQGEPSVRLESQGVQFWLSQCWSAVCSGQFFDGTQLYDVDLNETALPFSAAAPSLRAVRIASSLWFLARDFQSNGGMLADGGPVRFAGRLCRRMWVRYPDATQLQVFADAATWLLAGFRLGRDGDLYGYHDYRRVGPYWLAFAIDRNGAPLERFSSRTIVKEPFARPAGLTPQFSGDASSFNIDPQSVSPVGDCRIGDRTARCLIDTGGSGLSISLELAEELGLEAIGTYRVSGLGNYATEVVRAGPLQVGGARFPGADYAVLGDIHRYGYDLVLGADVLAQSRVTIDNVRKRILFERSSGALEGAGVVPIAFRDFVPIVNVTLNGVPAQLSVDTGDQSVINLSNQFYSMHPGLFSITDSRAVGGVGGESIEMLGRIRRVRVGDYETADQTIGVTRSLKGTADGHLGSGFLSQYSVIFDYAHARMQLISKSVNG